MRFERLSQFNRIQGNFASDGPYTVNFIPYYQERSSEFSMIILDNTAFFDHPVNTFRQAFQGFLVNNYSIGLSKNKTPLIPTNYSRMNFEQLIANFCRELTQEEVVHILGGYKEFYLEHSNSGKSLISGKFRTQSDILVYSFFYRTSKTVSDLFRFLANHDRTNTYRSILTLVLLGYMNIREETDQTLRGSNSEINGHANPNIRTQEAITPNGSPAPNSEKRSALQRLFAKIASI